LLIVALEDLLEMIVDVTFFGQRKGILSTDDLQILENQEYLTPNFQPL